MFSIVGVYSVRWDLWFPNSQNALLDYYSRSGSNDSFGSKNMIHYDRSFVDKQTDKSNMRLLKLIDRQVMVSVCGVSLCLSKEYYGYIFQPCW